MSTPWMQHVNRLCHQYLQAEAKLDYPPGDLLRLAEVQNTIYARLFADDTSLLGPPLERYRVRTLKELVTRVEAAIDDWNEHTLSNDLVTSLGALLGTSLTPETTAVQVKGHVTYHLSLLSSTSSSSCCTAAWNEPSITIRENRSLISASGTTGLRTWEAALHLGQYLCLNSHIVNGKRVFELGAGTGYLSILCVKHLSAAHALASDGSEDVVKNMTHNFSLNQVEDSSCLVAQKMEWGHALFGAGVKNCTGGLPIDVVLGADITYDNNVIPALIETIVDIMSMESGPAVYISATQRNEQTFHAFLDACYRQNLDVEDLNFLPLSREHQKGPFYNDQVPIRICMLSRK